MTCLLVRRKNYIAAQIFYFVLKRLKTEFYYEVRMPANATYGDSNKNSHTISKIVCTCKNSYAVTTTTTTTNWDLSPIHSYIAIWQWQATKSQLKTYAIVSQYTINIVEIKLQLHVLYCTKRAATSSGRNNDTNEAHDKNLWWETKKQQSPFE